jgi:hypothetical protein
VVYWDTHMQRFKTKKEQLVRAEDFENLEKINK